MALDYETTSSYIVYVTATGTPAKPTSVATVTINVIDKQEPPVFGGDATVISVREDMTVGVLPSALSATDPDAEDTLTYFLSDPGAAPFRIDSSSGILSVVGKLDYETKSSYKLTVIAVDPGGRTAERKVTINVTNVEEQPEFPYDETAELFVYEGPARQPVYDPTGALMATDGDKDSLIYTLGGTDKNSFNIVANTGGLTTKVPLVHGTDPDRYSLTVTASDGTLTDTLTVMVTLRNVTEANNRAPQFVDADGTSISSDTFTMAENAVETIIGTVEATDDNSDEIVYTLSGRDVSFFTVGSDNGELARVKPLDFDTRPRGYTVTVTASDGALTDTLAVTVTLTDVNERPMFVDENDNPISSTKRSIAESPHINRNIGAVVRATDPDGDRLTYTLEPANQAVFSVHYTSSGAQLRTRTALDREAKAEYTVTIFVRDSKDDDGATDTKTDDEITVTVEVTNVNERPRFVKADGSPIDRTREVEENQAPNALVGAAIVAIDGDGDNLTYSLRNANTAGVPFQIGTGGQITTTASLDRETRPTYTVTVYVSDRKNPQDERVLDAVNDYDDTVSITITVTDVDEADNSPPVFVDTQGNTITSTTRTIEESGANADVGLPVDARDPDPGDVLTYSLAGTDKASFSIDNDTGQLATAVPPDYEAKPVKRTYKVTVTATDPGRPDDTPTGPKLRTTIPVTITVTDVNEAPVFPAADNKVYVYEGAAGQKVIDPNGVLMATDPDAGDTFTYRLDANSQTIFAIHANTGVLTTKVALDYDGDPEPKRMFTVTVTATDGEGASSSTRVTITLTDVTETTNNAPTFTAGASTTRTVPENAGMDMTIDRAVGAVILATDADTSDTLTYRLSGADAASFDVVSATGGAQLRTAVVLDYETDRRTYTVRLTVSDGNTAVDATIMVNISVMDVSVADGDTDTVPTNTAPTFNAVGPVSYSIVEGTSVRDVGAPLTATDSDPGDTLTYAIKPGSDPDELFAIDTDGQLTTAKAVAPGSHELTVTVTDSKVAAEIMVTIDVTDDPTVNNPPMFEAVGPVSYSIVEGALGRTVDDPLTATDSDPGDTLTYAIKPGSDPDALFAIDTNGQLTTAKAVTTAGSPHTLTVTVIDGKDDEGNDAPNEDADSEIMVTISVTAVNEAPAFASGETAERSVAENTAAGEDIGAPVEATDGNSDDTLTYSLDTTGARSFAIVDTSGQLQTMAPLDHETTPSYTVTVTADDGNGGTDTIDVTITVNNVNEPPVFPATIDPIEVDENTVAGEAIGDPVVATDDDSGDTWTYTLGGTDAASFDIVPDSGQLQTMALLDYETKTDYEVTVIATDTDGLMDEITVTINVADVLVIDGDTEVTNRAPAFDDGPSTTREIAENTEADESIGDPVAAMDADSGDTLTYSLGGTDAGIV